MRLLINIGKSMGNSDDWFEPLIDDKSGQVALNWAYDNLINPTNYISEYTFSIKIERCPENERLFYNCSRLDSISQGFNPSLRYEYVIISDYTDIISRGSCFLDMVSDNEIKLSMLGSLNYVFGKLINSGWDSEKALQDDDYTLMPDYMKFNGASYTYPMYLTRRLVWTSFMVDTPIFSLSQLKLNIGNLPTIYGVNNETGWRECWCASLIGFAPTNCGYNDGFESDKWYYRGPKDEQWLLPVFAEDTETDYGIKATDRQVCEYRSYYQKPYVYVNKLFQIFDENFVNITDGWTLELDDRWFNDGNPQFAKSVFVLPNLFDGKDSDNRILSPQYDNGTFSLILPTLSDTNYWHFVESHGVQGWVSNVGGDMFTFHTDSFTVGAGQTGGAIVQMYPTIQNLNFPWIGGWGGSNSGWGEFPNQGKTVYFNPKQAFIVEVQGYSSSISIGMKKTYVVVPLPDLKSNDNFVFELDDEMKEKFAEIGEVIMYRYHATQPDNGNYGVGSFQFPCYFTNMTGGDLNVHFGISIKLYQEEIFSNNNVYTGWSTPFFSYVDYGVIADIPAYIYPKSGSPYITFTFDAQYGLIDTKRSGSPLTMERLFNGTNPFSILLKYTKMNNLIWLTDDYNKKVKVMHRYDYFLDCMTTDMGSSIPSFEGIFDLTNYVEFSKDYQSEMPSWDTHSVSFNFGDGDEDYADMYKEKYGSNYGSKFIVTENKKNQNNKDLYCNNEYDTVLPPICSTQIITPPICVKSNLQNVQKESEAFISNVKSEKNANVVDRFFFRSKNRDWLIDINGGYRDNFCVISDDCSEEFYNSKYAWHGPMYTVEYGKKVTECPNLTMSNANIGLIFGFPREVYGGIGSEVRVGTLYDLYWRKYIENIYDRTNKRVTCYVRMSSLMYRRFKANPLVKYENCAYIVAKIDGYNEKNTITKVTLVQIGNLDDLTNNNLNEFGKSLWLWDNGDYIAFDNGTNIDL